ncbi:MAG: hypothetical protein J6O17_00950 [Eubacterium sp.]|nr:hypothetical protein [Eubacterium sp.]
MKTRKPTNKIIYAIIFFTIMLIHFLVSSRFYALTQVAGMDESVTIGWVSIASSEKSWVSAVTLNKYYGFGFAVFASIFYLFTSDPVIIYHCLQIMVGIIYAFCGLICFRMLDYMVKPKNRKENTILIITSITCVFVPIKYIYFMNEHAIILINWLTVYSLIRLTQRPKSKKYTFSLILFLCYALTIHDRALVLWMGVVGSILIISIVKKKNYIYIPIGILAVPGFVGLRKVIKIIRHYIWNSGQVLANTSENTIATVFKKIPYLSKPINWIFPIITVISQLYFMAFSTCGAFFLVLFSGVTFIVRYIKRRRHNNTVDDAIFIILVYSILCIIVTIGIQAVSWMPDATTISPDMVWSEILGKRSKFYLRYFCSYCGPMLMLLSVFILKKLHYLKKSILSSGIAFVIVSILECIFVSGQYSDMLVKSNPAYTLFFPFSFLLGEKRLTAKLFIVSICVMAVLYAVVITLIYINKKVILTSLIMAVMVFQYVVSTISIYESGSERLYNKMYPIYQFMNEVDMEVVDDHKFIYKPDMTKDDMRLQYYLADYTLLNAMPDEIEDDKVIITNTDYPFLDDYLDAGFQMEYIGNYRIYVYPDRLPQSQ